LRILLTHMCSNIECKQRPIFGQWVSSSTRSLPVICLSTMTMKPLYKKRSWIWIMKCPASSSVQVCDFGGPTRVSYYVRRPAPFADPSVLVLLIDLPDAQDLIKNILKEDPKERFSIEQILSHSWWQRDAEDDDDADQEFDIIPHHGRQGSLTKREVHPVHSVQGSVDIFHGSASPQLASPLLASPVAQHPYGPWGNQSPFSFNPASDGLRATIPNGPAVPSPLGSPLPSPSPLTGKAFPRFEAGADGPISRSGSAGGFPTNAFEQRLLRNLAKIGFDQEIFTKGVPSQSCDPGYGLWCLLVDQVRQRAVDNGTTLEWEQNIALMDTVMTGNTASVTPVLADNGKRSPRPMSDPSPSSSQTNLSLTQATLIQQQQQQHADLQQQTVDLKLQLDQYKLETELLKMEKELLQKDKKRLVEASTSKPSPVEVKVLPPIITQTASGQPSSTKDSPSTPKVERPVQDSGASASTTSTPHSSWELTEREGPIVPAERPRRKSKGILHSLKDRFFSGGGSDVESSYSGSYYPPSPIPPKHLAGSTVSASSSASSATTYVAPKPLPAPPAHPYPHFLQQQHAVPHSPLSAVATKSASTSSLIVDTGHSPTTSSLARAAVSSENLVGEDHSEDAEGLSPAPQKTKGFMAWITESASGTVLNKSPVAHSPAKVPKRLNTRSFSTAETIPVPSTTTQSSTSSIEEARPQIPAIPASFFQPIWKSPTNYASSSSSLQSNGGSSSTLLATSAPSTTMSFRQRLASFSSSSAKITPEERQRAAAAAAAAAALVAQPTLPQRAHSPSPPSSPRVLGGSGSFAAALSPTLPKTDLERQNEINEIVAAAVAATASAHLKSSGSRKKKSKPSRSSIATSSITPIAVTTPNGDHQSTGQEEHSHPPPSSKPQSPLTLQIPSPLPGSPSKELSPSKESPRKPSIKSSKASMPSLMIAFSSFKPSKSAPSSPLVQQPIQLPAQTDSPKDTPKKRSHTKGSKDKGRNKHDDTASTISTTSTQPSEVTTLDTPTQEVPPKPIDTNDSAETMVMDRHRSSTQPSSDRPIPSRAFSDGVVMQDEARPKKRTTSRTSITAASLGRKSNESVASTLERSEPSSPHPPVGFSPSKRASLGSVSSRRSSSGSTRDRNIYGLTLDSGNLSRTSSLNHSRTPLNKSTFQSPGGSPAHTRRESASATSAPVDDRYKDRTLSRESSTSDRAHQRRSRASQEFQDGLHRENPHDYGSSSALQAWRVQGSTHSKRSSGSADLDTVKVQLATISPSLSSSSSLNGMRTSEKDTMSVTTGTAKDEDSFTTEAPRIDFADGCSLIPSPPPSPSPALPGGHAVRSLTSTMAGDTAGNRGLLEEPKVTLLSTSYPLPRTSLTFTPGSSTISEETPQDISPPSPMVPLVTFDQHFSNETKTKEHRDHSPRKVVGFQPLAAKRLSKPGAPNSAPTSATTEAVPPLPGQFKATTGGLVPTHPSTTSSSSFSSTIGPPNAFAGRRRVYRNSTGSMANMTLQQQRDFQQLQREQLQKIQQNQANAGYEATAAMKLNPRPRTTGRGPALGGLGGSTGGHSHLSAQPITNTHLGQGSDAYDNQGGAGGKRDPYSRRQSMAVAMGKRPGAAPAAIQEEEE